MTTIERASLLVLGAFLVVGCASTNVNRAKDVSSAGIHYAQTTSDVVGVAIDSMIDAESEAQVRSKPRPTEVLNAEERKKQLKAMKAQLNPFELKAGLEAKLQIFFELLRKSKIREAS